MNKNVTFSIENKLFVFSWSKKKTIEVNSLFKSYPVDFTDGKEVFSLINCLMNENQHNLLFIDKKVFELYKNRFSFPEDRIFKAAATEKFKSINGALKVVDFLEEHKFSRGDTLISIGGGIILDTAAFVSAIYRRGIPLISIPTTILSMSDSCIGGKANLNYKDAKNQLALFSTPKKVIVNPVFISTLKKRDIHSGMGEVLKSHIIGGEECLSNYCDKVKNGSVVNFNAYMDLIMTSLSVKRAIIEEDEFEKSYRKCLNYGHTAGHAIESMSAYKIPHGTAVVIGMIVSNELSRRRKLLKDREAEKLNRLLKDLLNDNIIKILKSLKYDSLMNLIIKDKKSSGKYVDFVFPAAPGDIVFRTIEVNDGFAREVTDIINSIQIL